MDLIETSFLLEINLKRKEQSYLSLISGSIEIEEKLMLNHIYFKTQIKFNRNKELIISFQGKKQWEYKEGNIVDIETQSNNKITRFLSANFDQFYERNEFDFKDSLKKIKHILKAEKKPIPVDWTDIFFDWATSQNLNEISIDQFPKITPEAINEWIENNLPPPENMVKIEAPPIEKPLKAESLPVRYNLLESFFQESQEFKDLHEKQKEEILAYILGTISRTARGIKNGEPKYIKSEHKERAIKLIEKIKKGIIL